MDLHSIIAFELVGGCFDVTLHSEGRKYVLGLCAAFIGRLAKHLPLSY